MKKLTILGLVSAFYFLVSAATFASLGVVLYPMVHDLGWSRTQAGNAFSVLALVCGLASPLPALLIRTCGTRATLCVGGLVLVAGFTLAAFSISLTLFLIAAALMGGGFTLVANVPAIHLINGWFEQGRERAVGFYLLMGGLGGVAGPSLARFIVVLTGSWRGQWQIMALLALVLTILCVLFIRDRRQGLAADQNSVSTDALAANWHYKAAFKTPQFFILTAAMTLTLVCMLTVNSATILHLSDAGISATIGAFVLSLQALASTLAKGASGLIGKRLPPRWLLAVGLALQAIGIVFLAYADTSHLAFAFAVLFGCGWGASFFAITILLVDYFGKRDNPVLLSALQLITTLAMIGPTLAGLSSDRWGSYTPLFLTYAGLLAVVTIFVSLMRPPVAPTLSRSGPSP